MKTNEQALSLRCCGPMPCGKHDHKNPPERFCVGSKCMAWRFAPEAVCSPDGTSVGWCGLAGKPQ